ncbi:MAG: hypothetical protein H0W35_00290 [Actinobacteria bacterium]|nr:hypothetical protein [Actinomycetota bacterium]MBA3561144.1 hypothetical protein [Actinomycetota bacterium]MBA3566048.1 hypothetical protein [Actinomycetota bacterium]MDQ3086835.1 hypothetical protein [Actinomycetota bacterium]
MRRLRFAALLGIVFTAIAFVASATADDEANDRGFRTTQPAMLVKGDVPAVGITPLLTVGDRLSRQYRFEAIPDGISILADEKSGRRVDVFVNHETSTVPFPYLPAATAEAHSQNDFDNSQLSHLTLDRRTRRVLSGRMAIRSSENFQRFCSNFLATREHGFDRPMVFTNEEGIDWVNRTGRAWPPPVGAAPDFEATDAAREIGVVVAYDVQMGKSKRLWGMGRHNHENSVAIPGYRKPVLLSGDDTFVSLPPQSQLYMYTANNRKDLWNGRGDLLAFVADTPVGITNPVNDYFDFHYGAPTGTPRSVSGRFVKVPDFREDRNRSIAHGLRANRTDVTSRDFSAANGYNPAYTPPPTSGWQQSPFAPPHGIDGPQWVLEQWGDRSNVFQFIRVEDIAYDKRPGMQNIVYIVDSGAGSNGAPKPGVLSTNGRIWRMELDKRDPTRVLSLSVLVDGDENPVSGNTGSLVPPTPVSAERASREIRQPDNLDTTAKGSMLVTEDPGSRQQFPATSTDPFRTTARVWQVTLPPSNYNPSTAAYDALTKRVVARVDQSLDERAGYDKDPADAPGTPPAPAFFISPGNLGVWESSGVIDTSSVFGPGTFLIAVQAHTLAVDWRAGDLNTVSTNDPLPDFQYKREGGQLLLMRIPGA